MLSLPVVPASFRIKAVFASYSSLSIALLLMSSVAVAAVLDVPAGADAVANGKRFEEALGAAKFGDTIVLQAGGVYSPTHSWGFHLLDKGPGTGTDADFITIRTSNLAGLSREGERIDPRIHAAAMPKIMARGGGMAISLYGQARSHHWKIVGLEITSDGTADSPGLVNLGAYIPYSDRIFSRTFIFDRCFVHPPEVTATNLATPERTSISKAVGAVVNDFRLFNSYVVGGGPIEKFSGETGSGMGVLSDVGPGPMLVENNYIEAFYSPIFLGGADGDALPERTAIVQAGATVGSATLSRVGDMVVGDYVAFELPAGATPSRWGIGKITSINGTRVTFDPVLGGPGYQRFDLPPLAGGIAKWRGTLIHDVVFRRNTIMANGPHFRYLLGKRGSKAFIEVKQVNGLLMEGNTFLSGLPTVVLLYPINQNGGFPWAEVSNVTIRNNWLQNASFILALKPNYNVQQDLSHDIQIQNNVVVMAPPEDTPGSVSYFVAGPSYGRRITFSHNTVLTVGSAMYSGFPGAQELVVKDNILSNGTYGFNCEVGGMVCYTGWTILGNVIIDRRSAQDQRDYPLPYRDGNFIANSDSEVGWVSPSTSNYRLSATSSFKGKATDGTDPGADIDTLMKALNEATTRPSPPQQFRTSGS